MKKKILIILIVAIIIGCTIFIVINNQKTVSSNFLFDEEYTIETDDQFKTLKNDGGSHYNRKYIIDLKKQTVSKKEDYYEGFEGEKYKDKELYKKNLTKSEIKELKKIIKEIINDFEEDTINPSDTSTYYTLSCKSYDEIKIYKTNIIDRIEKIVKNK